MGMQTKQDALSIWQRHLEAELEKAVVPRNPREGNFDMDDEPESRLLTSFPLLQEALDHLRANLVPMWRTADHTAMINQRRHRWLARVVVGAGTSAIILAILQIGVVRQMPSLVTLALSLEVLAVAAGTIAVAVALWTKGDRKWLCERNRAERLRMLKFRALGWPELWSNKTETWKQRADREAGQLGQFLQESDVHKWNASEHTGPEVATCAINCDEHPDWAAFDLYYRVKRLDFQSHYFEKRSREHQAAARPWRHLSLPVFLTSTVCVLVHFAADWLLRERNIHAHESAVHFWEIVEIWSLALAAILPVAGLGIRVWLGAFEPHRSANLFSCKFRTVQHLCKRMGNIKKDPQVWTASVAEAELFFENEHREWLRLMLETEYML